MNTKRYSNDHVIYTSFCVYNHWEGPEDTIEVELDIKVEFNWSGPDREVGHHGGPEDVYVSICTEHGASSRDDVYVRIPAMDPLFDADSFVDSIIDKMQEQVDMDLEDHRY